MRTDLRGRASGVVFPLVAGLLGLMGLSPASAQDWHRVEVGREAMGTEFRITICASDTTGIGGAIQAAWEVSDRIDAALSDYSPQSEVSRISQTAHRTETRVSPILWSAWTEAEIWHDRSEGALDVTLGALTRLWRRSVRRQSLPDSMALSEARLNSGRHLVQAGVGTLKFAQRGLRLDFGAIGKGSAADSMLAVLRSAGFPRSLIDAGGDVTAGDPAPGSAGWRVRVPTGEVWSLSNASVASSGDSEKFVQIGSQRYSHILDPDSGLGLINRTSVTVLAETGAAADALATTLSIRPHLATEMIRGDRVVLFVSGGATRTVGSPPLSARCQGACCL